MVISDLGRQDLFQLIAHTASPSSSETGAGIQSKQEPGGRN